MATFKINFFVILIFAIFFKNINCRSWQYKHHLKTIFQNPSPVKATNARRQYLHHMQSKSQLSSYFLHWIGKRDFLVLPPKRQASQGADIFYNEPLTSRKTYSPRFDLTDLSNREFLKQLQKLDSSSDYVTELFPDSLASFNSDDDGTKDDHGIISSATDINQANYYVSQAFNDRLTDNNDIIENIEETLPLSAVIDGDLIEYSNDQKVYPEQLYFKDINMPNGYSEKDVPQSLVRELDLKTNMAMAENATPEVDGLEENEHSVASTEDTNKIINTLLNSIQLLLESIAKMDTRSKLTTVTNKRASYKPEVNYHHLSKRPANIYSPISPHRPFYFKGNNDRFQVVMPLMRRYPYSNVVRLSSGCTGTLLTPYHVLTAAHCVHNGEEFKTNLEMLKIEIPDTMGFRVYYIKKISIPKSWRRSGHLSDTARASFDYAIVRLSVGVPGKTEFVPLSVPKLNVLNQDMNFLGFRTDESSGLYKSECRSPFGLSFRNVNLIVANCDSVVGNSGAAVFIDDPREGKRIVGVLSYAEESSRYSFIMALTWNKLYDICSMISHLGQIYGVCPDFETIPRMNPPVHNRIIPFFGRK
ncbi:hypothetical protein LOTGIDRAFT_173852 [Lottia gigantea]|uniref:Peptidase S1 domain-containing protein n=1 Tax=Lottia gigantea TaxID=225164 RepID=V4AVL8_LOTGI|nr:hypothetical protein LOTGIDRAFT_173852 [Lottia gigantea]ESO99110.1 hypothetical protein LOTGIDRAFT_173852 [Lottia gigantea]